MTRVPSAVLLSAICASALLVSGCAGAPAQQDVTASAPKGGSERAAVRDTAAPEPSPVLPVRPADAAAKTPSATVSRTTGTTRNITGSGLRLSSYDAAKHRAELTPARSGSGKDNRTPKVREGDVIASPPSRELPRGALVKVVDVRSTDGPRTEVSTEPANLTELFGNARAEGDVPVDPDAWKVEPLVAGLDVSRRAADGEQRSARGIEGGFGLGTLRIDLDAPLPLPPAGDGGKAPDVELGGFVELSPEVAFSYHRRSALDLAPANASIRLAGPYRAGWRMDGDLALGKAIRVPFARLTARPVINVGPVPVVVNLGLTLSYEVTASGKVTVRLDQEVRGQVTVGARYSAEEGWEPDVQADGKATPVTMKVTGKGEARAAIATEASVGLYDSVGISATFAPYLRATAEGTASKRGAAGAWGLYGGVRLDGALHARLAVFGTPLGEYRIPIPLYSREWPIAEGRTPAV
ncbi:hypothetical protein [Streptomyces sp. NPDC048639]|uniref:hypothetical protein n=1 Tax=Streptomyces sp. NPDC048639 TaxID=3365581 RepID=UPI00371D791E